MSTAPIKNIKVTEVREGADSLNVLQTCCPSAGELLLHLQCVNVDKQNSQSKKKKKTFKETAEKKVMYSGGLHILLVSHKSSFSASLLSVASICSSDS